MSYNPNRQKASVSRRQRRLDPRAGVRFSDVVARFGPRAATIEDVRWRVNTPRGWKVDIHVGESFEMIYEFICARNSTGMIKNQTQDRAIRVLSGLLFVTVNVESAAEMFELRAGSSYSFPMGTEYQLSTSGDFDSEVIFCQEAKYEDGIEQLSPPNTVAVSSAKFPEEEKPMLPLVDPEKAQKHAEKIKAVRQAREARRKQALGQQVQEEEPSAEGGTPAVRKTPPPSRSRTPLSGQQVVGVNPRPIGAGGYGE